MVFLLLHGAEEHVGAHTLRHEIGRMQHLAQGAVVIHRAVEQVFSHAQDADHIVDGLFVHRDARQAGFADGAQNLLVRCVRADGDHVGAVGHDVEGGVVVELEDVVDHLAFGLGDGTLFFTEIGHHADVLLGDAVFLRIGINAAETKHAVGGNRQQPDQRFHHGGKAQNHAADHLGHRVGLLHGDALGNEFAENQREIGEDDGNQDHTDGIEDVLIHVAEGVRLHQCFDHRAGEIIRRESRSQKAGKRYGDLDGGEEFCGLLGQFAELFCPSVSRFLQLCDFCFIY